MMKVINKYGRDRDTFYNLFKKDGNTPKHSGLVFCPFHDNFKTPAAKFYKDEDAEKLWCFSENRMYSLSDYIEKILGADLNYTFSQIWESLSDSEKEEYTNLFGNFEYNVKVEDLDLYSSFRSGNLTFSQLLEEITKR